MNKLKLLQILIIISILVIGLSCSSAKNTQSVNKNPIIAAMELANKYFMEKWPDAAKNIYVPSKNKTWPSHIWIRAVYYEGLMALYSIDKKAKYYNYAVQWGENHNWGLWDGIKTRNGDNQA